MSKQIDLTEGNIVEKLVKLSLPIMGTAFIQIAYSLIDMIWVGKIGSKSVAAVGTAGFYPWLAMAFIMISRVGGEIKVSQSVGEKNEKDTKYYIKSAIEINMILSFLYSLTLIFFRGPLVAFFKLGDIDVISMSKQYLLIIGFGMMFYFINPVFTSIFVGLGNSKSPFKINTIGLVTNIILDPILIFGIGPFPTMGVIGAALATIISHIVVFLCFVSLILKDKSEHFKIKLFREVDFTYYKTLFILGTPVALQNGLFTVFSMIMGVIVASFGPVAIAVQKVGSQIESISWNSCDGFASALSSLVGQNYGAKKIDRLNELGYTGEKANQIARHLLPIGTESAVMIGFDIEGLIHLANIRLCTRAELPIRKITQMMIDEVKKVTHEYDDLLVCKCDRDLFCIEDKCCGRRPTKEQLKNKLND